MASTMGATTTELLVEIEMFLACSGMSATKFGVAAVNDGHLVANLRRGSSVTLKTADRVRAYIGRQRQSQRLMKRLPPRQCNLTPPLNPGARSSTSQQPRARCR